MPAATTALDRRPHSLDPRGRPSRESRGVRTDQALSSRSSRSEIRAIASICMGTFS
jgi:hypothetical protein